MINIVGNNKTYKIKNNKIPVLKNIHISIDKPGLCIFTGESGSGKSTLLNCLSGIDQWDEQETNNVKGNCSFIFQDYHLFSHMTAYENVKFAMEINHKKQMNQIDSVFNELQIQDVKEHEPNQLSGGQQQRVAIARAILIDKPYILADEPTGNLDEKNALDIAHYLKEVSKNKAVIVATHDLSLFIPLADEVYKLEHGEIIDHQVISHKQSKNIEVGDKDEERLNFNHILRFSSKGYKTKYSRLVILLLTLLLSFLTTLTAINILTNDIFEIKERQMIKHQISDVEFVKYGNNLSSGLMYSITGDEIESLVNKYNIDNYMLFTDQISPQVTYNNQTVDVHISRIYRTSHVTKNTILGVRDISYGEVIITQELASELVDELNINNVNELINLNIAINEIQLEIVDIFVQQSYINGQDNVSTEASHIDALKHSIYMNESTYFLVSHATRRDYINVNINEFNNNIRITDLNQSFFQALAFGTLDVDNDEVVIDYHTALSLSDDMSQLIGTDITLDINQYTFNINDPIGHEYRTYTIRGIFQTNNEDIPWLFSEDEFNLLSYNFGMNNYQTNALNGIVVDDISKHLLKEFDSNQITDYTYISQSINITNAYIDSIALLISILGVILFVISILITLSYVNNSIIAMKNEIGILRSLNISLKDIMKIFVTEVTLISITTVIIVSIIHVFIIQIINYFLQSLDLISFNYLYYNYLSVIIIFFVPLSISLVFVKVITNKLNKLNSIELIRYS